MKTVSIRELHNKTGKIVREASRHGDIRVTDNGQVVARIVPEIKGAEVPYFARRKYSNSEMKKLIESGRLGSGGADSTQAISEDREERI